MSLINQLLNNCPESLLRAVVTDAIRQEAINNGKAEASKLIEPALIEMLREFAPFKGTGKIGKINLIKIVRQYTGKGLKDSKEFVERYIDNPYAV
jgi:ribosomal protein L7/L12